MTSPIADRVMAATHRLVQQAMSGQWSEVPRTVEERRVLLDQLTASATAHDRPWLDALKQAMAESDAAVAKMRAAGPQTADRGPAVNAVAAEAANGGANLADNMMDMIRGSR